MKKVITIIVSLTAIALLQSCNTMNGVGRDLTQFGSGVSNTATGKTWDGKPLQRRGFTPAPANR